MAEVAPVRIRAKRMFLGWPSFITFPQHLDAILVGMIPGSLLRGDSIGARCCADLG